MEDAFHARGRTGLEHTGCAIDVRPPEDVLGTFRAGDVTLGGQVDHRGWPHEVDQSDRLRIGHIEDQRGQRESRKPGLVGSVGVRVDIDNIDPFCDQSADDG